MRRIALALGVVAFATASATAQAPASIGTPIPAAQLGTPIASSVRVRAQADDTPTLGVPEPYPNAATPGSYYTPAYAPVPNYPQAQLTSQSIPYPSYDNYGPPSNRGEAVRRTSYSSRSTQSESRFGCRAKDCANDCCDWLRGCFAGEGRSLFQSDHCMDSFSSPITNPFLFEDPRSLTELRPILFYQKIPGSNPVFQGGTAYFYGTQARLSLTDRWSVTLNKLGGVTINPGENSGLADATGLAEFHIGPKFTFLRNSESGTAAAIGTIFQIPVGPAKVFQDTGSFSMVPYVSVAQNFLRSSYGAFNFMDTLGYSFRLGSDRSDYLYNSAHLDYDIANLHKFYPLVELNWFHYTRSGNARAINQEGRDFANFGGTNVDGRDYLTIAPGLRYKYSERIQAGVATEFPLTNPRDLQNFRLLVDLIFRY